MSRPLTMPRLAKLTTLTAALKLAAAGWAVLPTAPDDIKNPGSVVGKWSDASTVDAAQVAAWWAEDERRGIALHAGKAGDHGVVVVDVDAPDLVPAEWWPILDMAPYNSTSRTIERKGHYFFLNPAGKSFGNRLGGMAGGWGDIRSGNGVVIAPPTSHPKAVQGGRYWQIRAGVVPPLPAGFEKLLEEVNVEVAHTLTDAEIAEFIAAHKGGRKLGLVKGPVKCFRKWVLEEGESRHTAMREALRMGFRDVHRGDIPADYVIAQLRQEFHDALMLKGAYEDLQKDPRGDVYGLWFRDLMRFAIERAAKDVEKDEELESGPDSWEPVDIESILRGEYVAQKATILHRSDEQALFYAGKTHWLFGETESGKTWLALVAVAEVLNNGGKVVFVDFEDDAPTVVQRLLLLGVPRRLLAGKANRFLYIRPERSAQGSQGFLSAQEFGADLVVLDGVTESLGLEDMSTKDNDDIAAWQQRIARPWTIHGAAVVAIDHVTKAKDGRGRFPIGAQHKLSGISGAGYIVLPREVLARGVIGVLDVRVAKDRPADVRTNSGPYDSADRTQQAAVLYLDARNEDEMIVEVAPPDETKSATVRQQENRQNKDFEIAWAICTYLQSNPGAGSRTIRKGLPHGNTDIDRVLKKLQPDFIRLGEGPGSGLHHYLTEDNVHQTERFDRAWAGAGK